MMTLAEIPGEAIPLAAILGSAIIALVAVVSGAITQSAKTKQREQTRREVAAYVAEGSMTPDEAERILKAGRAEKKGGCGSSC